MKSIILNDLNEINIRTLGSNMYFMLEKNFFENKIICFEFIEEDALENWIYYLTIKISDNKVYLSRNTLIDFDDCQMETLVFTQNEYNKFFSYNILEDIILIRMSNNFIKFDIKIDALTCNVYVFKKDDYEKYSLLYEKIERKYGLVSIQDLHFKNF